jgi:hypothetical protein
MRASVSTAVLGHVLRSVGVGDGADKRMPLPVFTAGELVQGALGEGVFAHGRGSFLWFLVAAAAATLALAKSGVCKPQAPAERKKMDGAAQRRATCGVRTFSLRYGWKGL